MNDTTNTYFCEQCCESVKHGAKICPHCLFERFPGSDKTKRKEKKRKWKRRISCTALPLALTLFGSGILYVVCSEKDDLEKFMVFIRHCFLALVCLHFYAFHIIHDEDEKKGGDDGGGGGGGGE